MAKGDIYTTISIERDERWPDFTLEDNLRFGHPVKISIKTLKWIEDAIKEYSRVQKYLEKRYSKDWGSD